MTLALLMLAAAPCTPVAPEIGVPVAFKKGATVGDLVAWASGVTCEEFELDDAEKAEKLTVSANGALRASEVRPFTVALAASANVMLGCRRSFAKGIRPIDATTFELDRAVVDKVMSNSQCITTSARIVPAFKDGKAIGLKLFAIRPDNFFALLGFQNGDIVRTVNGLKLDTPDAALAAYQKLKSEKELKVDVERKGEPQQLLWKVK